MSGMSNGVTTLGMPRDTDDTPVGRPESPLVQKFGSPESKIIKKRLTGYVGFANLPNQWHRKSVRKGFNFNVMVVGMFSLLNPPCG